MKTKPVLDIGIDLDGVCYPIEYDFVDMMKESVDPTYTADKIKTWKFYQDLGLSDDEFNKLFAKYINDEKAYIAHDPYPGVNDAIWKLHKMGHRLHVVTHREVRNAETACMLLTHAWLAKQKWPLRSVTIAADKAIIRTDIFIDDGVHNLERLEEVSVATTGVSNAVCMSRPWNDEWKGLRINKISELVKIAEGVERIASQTRG